MCRLWSRRKLDQGPTCGLPRTVAAVLLLLGLSVGAALMAPAPAVASPQVPAAAAGQSEHRRFLLIYSEDSTLAANREATQGASDVFGAVYGANYEIFAEYRDDQRFPGVAADRIFAEDMTQKYRGMHFDAILAFGSYAMRYALDHRSDLGIDAPVVFGGVSADILNDRALTAAAYGIRSEYSVRGTLDLARRLQPGARRAVVMTGSAPFDRQWETSARAALAGVEGIAIDYVSGLTLPEFKALAAGLGPDTILIILTIFRDASGQSFTPVNAAEIIARGAGAPAYSVYDTFIGRGVVGGAVQRFRDIGAAMAEDAVRLIAGEPVTPTSDLVPIPIVDWRQMQRFGLARDRLPPGARLEHYQPPPWERYRTPILLAATVILAQSATIAALVVQGRRRRIAEQEASERRIELAHMSRVAQLGELSGALAHELNQPLTAILANAAAGTAMLGQDPPDLAEVAGILDDIAEDDRRAAAIIVEMRRLLAKGEVVTETLDLNDAIDATIALARGEFLTRQVVIDRHPPREALLVRANLPQMKQVILNLLLNAADAMVEVTPTRRVIDVMSRVRADGWREVAVADRGSGLAAEVAADPFRPFATTKPHGLGLGLSICRTIVQTHGGMLYFESGREEGAMVIIALPPP